MSLTFDNLLLFRSFSSPSAMFWISLSIWSLKANCANSLARYFPCWDATWAVGAYLVAEASPSAYISLEPDRRSQSSTISPRPIFCVAGNLDIKFLTTGRDVLPVAHTKRPYGIFANVPSACFTVISLSCTSFTIVLVWIWIFCSLKLASV